MEDFFQATFTEKPSISRNDHQMAWQDMEALLLQGYSQQKAKEKKNTKILSLNDDTNLWNSFLQHHYTTTQLSVNLWWFSNLATAEIHRLTLICSFFPEHALHHFWICMEFFCLLLTAFHFLAKIQTFWDSMKTKIVSEASKGWNPTGLCVFLHYIELFLALSQKLCSSFFILVNYCTQSHQISE